MAKIIFYSWEVGMMKIPFIKLLNKKAGLSLTMAKKMKDRLVDLNESIIIEVDNDDLAKEILNDAKMLKVNGRLE